MVAEVGEASGEVVFRCGGEGINFRSCDSVHHMHEGRVRRVAPDRIESRWTPLQDGEPAEPVTFSLARVAKE